MILCLLVVKNDDEFYSYVDCQDTPTLQVYSPSERNPNFYHFRESQAILIIATAFRLRAKITSVKNNPRTSVPSL